MYIPEEKVSEILAASDIVEIVSKTVILKKSGSNFFGLCPFHSEKTPSFSVNANKQIFHCFGCGVGGNALSYIMKYHGVTFPEAAGMLARQYGITIDVRDVDPGARSAFQLKEGLFRLNKTVMHYYTDFLKTSPLAESARSYLSQRGIGADTIEQFQLGFSLDSWDSVVQLIKKKKVSRRVATASGLVLARKNGTGFYDRFRNRIMFPIFDINMQVAGFGGRVMDDAMPKYMNSPETPVYSKSRILYGLHAAKPFCREMGAVYIVEGYFDFLSLFRQGIRNVVASSGTALTSEHVRILKGYAPLMVLVFDSDAAGIKAAKRSVGVFLKEGVDTRILVLPKGEDPDSYVLKNGAEAFKSLAADASTVMQFLLSAAIDEHGLTLEGRASVLNDMKRYLCQIQDSALRSLYVKQLAETLNIDEAAVLEKVREEISGIKDKSSHLTLNWDEDEKKMESDRREQQVISMMLNYPELIPEMGTARVVDYFYSERLKRIAGKILCITPGKTGFITDVMTRMETDEERQLIASCAIDDFSGQGEADIKTAAKSIIHRIIRVRKKQENKLTNKISSAEKGGDAELMELLKQKQAEIRQLHH